MTGLLVTEVGYDVILARIRRSTCPLTVIRSRVVMSGTLEKVSSMKAYGGDLIKYKFKVGRASCRFSPLAGRLLTGIDDLVS